MSESQNEPQKLFDVSKHFNVAIISGGEKRCVLRWPTDDEWIRLVAQQKNITHILGRGASKSDIPNFERVNATLFEKIRIDKDGEPFDVPEASSAIQRLQYARIKSVEREGNCYRIEMRVPGATTVHTLKVPTKAQQLEHERGTLDPTDARRQQITTVHLRPSGDLYDSIVQSAEGYAGAAPITHKQAVVTEVLAQIKALEEEDYDPEA